MFAFVRSVYIPRVVTTLSMEKVASILTKVLKLGNVARMERIPKKDAKTGAPYFKYYIHFDEWFEGPNPDQVTANCQNQQPTKMYYSERAFWWILPNTSDLQQTAHCPPQHISLTCYLPADISISTVNTVMHALDLGQIHCIHYPSDVSSTSSYHSDHRWFHSSPTLWDNVLRLPMREITVHYDYWYRTRSAVALQQQMESIGSADVPVFPQMAWTFYPVRSITDGINPHVWESPANVLKPSPLRKLLTYVDMEHA